MHTMYYNYGYKVAFWIEIMYSKNIDSHSFLNALTKYIRENHLDITDTPLLDTLIENPDMQRLMSIWLQTNNESQLNHLLLPTLDRLSRMSEEEQNQELHGLLEQAKFLNSMIPAPSDLDIVLESMGEAKTDTWDGWSDFNLSLAEISSADMKKIQNHIFFINAGVFTANVVAGMSIAETAAFDARVDAILKEHADFIMPVRVFSDKLVALIKSDVIIRDILAGVKAIQPFVIPIKSQVVEDDDLTDSADESENVSADLLAQYLGFDDDESTVDSAENISSISDATTNESQDLNTARVKPASSTLTDWQKFNIETHDLYELILIGEIDPYSIPDRELTQKEVVIYQFMKKLMRDLPDTRSRERVSLECDQSISPQSGISSADTSGDVSSYRSSNSQAYEYPTKEPRRIKTKDSRETFIPVIKDTTHNVNYKERNRNQRKPDYLGKEGTGMPRWHRQYKERMQQKIQNSSANDTHVSNPSDKPKPGSKFGKF